MTVEEFRDAWENRSELFDPDVKAWTGKKSEGYRVLTALMEEMEDV